MKTKFVPSEHRLSFNHQETLEDLADSIRYTKNKSRLGGGFSLMESEHIKIGRDAYFGGGDIKALKQNFHVSAKLASLGSIYSSGDGSLFTWPDYLYGMLSDSPAAIHACSTMATAQFIERRDKPTVYQFYRHMYQLAIREEYSELDTKLTIAKKSTVKKVREHFEGAIEFFSLFLERDKKGLEELILKEAKRWQTKLNRNADTRAVITSHVMAADAMEYAKLCWLKGIEVEIDHPLFPMELLPLKPLEHYDDVYDFLSSDWTPPTQNFIQKITKWFSK